MKIGIFGGTFNPIHNEHINIIKNCLETAVVDKVLITPTYKPWHKDSNILDYEHRKAIIDLTIENISNCEVDEIEQEENLLNSYSCEVLERLKQKYKDDEIYFILGGDSLFNIYKWKNFEDILRNTKIIAVEREGYHGFTETIETYKERYNSDFTVLKYKGGLTSSSLITTKLELSYDVSGLIDEKALRYIKEQKLYNKYEFYLNQLRQDLSERTYNHSLRTVLFVIPFVGKLYLSYEEVFLSALLHDNAKEKTEEFYQFANKNINVIHQFLGAKRAEVCYNINNKNIINAIKYHTTAKKDMTDLEKLIYAGDMLEENRDFEGVEYLRELIRMDFQKGFIGCLESSYKNLVNRKIDIDNYTKEAYNFYIKKDKDVD